MHQFISFLFIVLITGCTSPSITRVPAQKDDLPLKEIFEEAMTFPLVNGGSLTEDFSENYIERSKFIKRDDLGENVAFKIEFDKLLPENEFSYRIYHSPLALGDEAALGELQLFINTFENYFYTSRSGTNKIFPLELYYNAKEGDPFALQALLKIKEEFSLHKTKDSTKKILETKIKELKTKRAQEKKSESLS